MVLAKRVLLQKNSYLRLKNFLSCQTAETEKGSQKRDPEDIVDGKDRSDIKRRVESEETVIPQKWS